MGGGVIFMGHVSDKAWPSAVRRYACTPWLAEQCCPNLLQTCVSMRVVGS